MDAFLVTDETNVYYLSGFSGHDSLLLVTQGESFFITDSRYIEEAKGSVRGFKIKLVDKSTYSTLGEIVKKGRLGRVGFESMNLPYEVAGKLKRMVRPARLVPIKDLVERLRAVKDVLELEAIKDSIALTKKIFKSMARLVRPGISEKFIARQAEIAFIKRASHPSFDLIVAAGANSSKPHASPADKRIAKNSFVMMDMGCNLNGYNSDITRMVVVGKMQEKFRKIYDIVHTAQVRAIAMIRPGRRIAEVDLAARGYIQDQGFGKYFGHALGHGVGMAVHEQPNISRINEELLKPGMVFTVEPAIYIPEFGGVRIEDMVLVTDKGCEVLTR